MTRRLSRLVAWICTAALLAVPAGMTYLLIDINAFSGLARDTLALGIQWQTVVAWQWYALWLLAAAYAAIGVAGLFFLRRAFINFSRGELFNAANSRDLRRFALLLLAQGLLAPLQFALSSILLSINHGPGQKMLALSFGSGELKMIGLTLVFWVVSNLLLEGAELQAENRQFV